MADPERAEMSASEIAEAVRRAQYRATALGSRGVGGVILVDSAELLDTARALLAQTATLAARDKRIEALEAVNNVAFRWKLARQVVIDFERAQPPHSIRSLPKKERQEKTEAWLAELLRAPLLELGDAECALRDAALQPTPAGQGETS
ncbi:MAG: hypothetical protein WA210_09070 [Burkholderiaceae bacterium]